MRATSDQLFAIKRQNKKYYNLQNIKLILFANIITNNVWNVLRLRPVLWLYMWSWRKAKWVKGVNHSSPNPENSQRKSGSTVFSKKITDKIFAEQTSDTLEEYTEVTSRHVTNVDFPH